ncbi:hypothetical protein GOP47_0003170 [Adiantum capillus-veneris]|uniref:DEK-C domain-containing protein n=1 Tax=Adiantum capillus-veneris TaxID=13818 RepID=A0A9D4VDG2_ADICA|nr:hypothetical protein GOP47_0003170 [Adiantum capillus-veneris]
MATESSSPSEEEVRETVLQILQEADLENMTEFKVRASASEKLGADLNQPVYKKLVRKVVGDYLDARADAEAEAKTAQPADEEEEGDEAAANVPPLDDDAQLEEVKVLKSQNASDDDDDDGQPSRFARKPPLPALKQKKQMSGGDDDNLICQLSSKRNVSIQKFRGKTLVSIREYYEKDGELRPSAKGISLSVDQWKVLKNNVSAVEKAIAEFQ